MIALNQSTDDQGKLEPGQLVYHVRYHYRGVIVLRDESCKADDDWYHKNNTQPNRAQPWYHVLVDDSTTCTYVAAENLIADTTGTPISHPLVERLFDDFTDGQYVRNDTPWPT